MEQTTPYEFTRRDNDEATERRRRRHELAEQHRQKEKVEAKLAQDALQLAFA